MFKTGLRFLLSLATLLLLVACGSSADRGGKLTIGTVSYSEGTQAIKRYARFKDYLAEKAQNFVELDPAYNEQRAIERIRNHSWSLVFAPPGLAAIAIKEAQYQPVLPLQGVENRRSVLVVRKDSPIQTIKELANHSVALGQIGSSTSYYFPLYNLYGLTLSELLFAPTPKSALEWVASGKATAGALSKEELDRYAPEITSGQFRVLAADEHFVPAGVLLIGPNIERNRQDQLRQILKDTPSPLAQEAGFIPNGSLPDYSYMFSVVDRVRSIFPDAPEPAELKPARLYGNARP
ncbi:phosphate/phosphite/phosphonate ABC transporter substrate-binding protein [Gloeobacter kilaueensis]|uniref:ABC-type phosphate/phosphonate transport system, periplasmic component n=1 Tax=Gloeobacter kilaueensis (strain ATCC BAA-2537 / CCAP 1431/1 / ULC 316 / JS1) TaxID=1183438 RepID=U5QJZ3_GLOK1|nr:PhnD/SsuA/transferrin family substrate-binding protein [Gloeobacter kilaueensis]AGY59246.1 ABC-type phosphate/phosphonate transport system, periplasmic component [Gloeobacter kilaueensis JS1]